MAKNDNVNPGSVIANQIFIQLLIPFHAFRFVCVCVRVRDVYN